MTWRRFIGPLRLVFVTALAALLAAVFFYYHLYWTSPREIGDAAGSVVALSEHGTVFYVQDWQNVVLLSLLVLGGIGFLGVVCLDVHLRARRGVVGAHLEHAAVDPDKPDFLDIPVIVTRRMNTVFVAAFCLCFPVVGTSGGFPFSLIP